MDRDTAVNMAQQAIKAKNRRLIDAVLKIRAGREPASAAPVPVSELPLVAVTCATGWECYAIVDELTKTRKFRVRALYRTPGTQAAARLERLLKITEQSHPGLLTLHPNVDMNSEAALTSAFAGCDGVVLYVTANTSKAGKITNHGKDPVGGRAAVMRQVMAALGALRANPTVGHVITLVFPPDKVSGIADYVPEIPWWIHQRLLISNFLRGQGVNVTCIYRPSYYYAMHRVDYTTAEAHLRGDTSLSRTMIRENNIPGITEPDFLVNWVDVRDVGKWVGTCFEYPEVFSNQDFSIASSAHTGHELVAIATRENRHGTSFRYRQFPLPVMKLVSFFSEEVVYPLRYAQWYNHLGNAYDFASNEDLADLDRIHPRWTFEKKLEAWGINDIRPGQKS
ncbi:MAG: NmrA family NAD(P)-binding protein [Gammaproteobacteria bacterium]|nr:NmrA family NAD(P)-binding protein [Gammaproteobacteria bacterium]